MCVFYNNNSKPIYHSFVYHNERGFLLQKNKMMMMMIVCNDMYDDYNNEIDRKTTITNRDVIQLSGVGDE